MNESNSGTTAESESETALRDILVALDDRRNFKVEAGAGAGKTYSLIETLRHILRKRSTYLPLGGQRIACVTYTNVARNEIVRRTDASPYIFAETIHGFLWEIVSPFKKSLLQEIVTLPGWERTLDGRTSLQGCSVSYDLGFRRIEGDSVHLHHDDVPALAIRLFSNAKFRSLVSDRFPIILVDEYQDTPAGLAEAMIGGRENKADEPTYGFFGDHWQQIYDRSCGSIDHLSVAPIAKRANWRSGSSVVRVLNHMRPELPQATVPDAHSGSVTVYHTNNWIGPRGARAKKGQIPDATLSATLSWVMRDVGRRHTGNLSQHAKVLMLTHASIATELGFGNIDRTFKYNDDYVRKSDEVVAFLLDVLEPCCNFFRQKKYGLMFDVLRRSRPRLKQQSDKIGWSDLFQQIDTARQSGTVGDVLDIILRQSFFAPPQALIHRQHKWASACRDLDVGQELSEPRRLAEYGRFREVSYSEVIALHHYIEECTPFSTQHGVKGAEYPSVVAVFGGGWTRYNFPRMLADFPRRSNLSKEERGRFERTRNLFYVACSRAKRDLVLIFTTELPDEALDTLRSWVGPANIVAVHYSPSGDPMDLDPLSVHPGAC
ncbi:UvrD-helicase domain-containing protein [Streptomyces goshikiensis]|uniref:UvrD-helicase domain-containing protein n=1 Tax=Streptomyces goshikiensis TaxID=1942 RepID=UPI0037A2E75C